MTANVTIVNVMIAKIQIVKIADKLPKNRTSIVLFIHVDD